MLARTHTHTNRHTDTQTHRHTDTQTHRHTDTQTHRHTDTQTHRHTDTTAGVPNREHSSITNIIFCFSVGLPIADCTMYEHASTCVCVCMGVCMCACVHVCMCVKMNTDLEAHR